MAETLERLKRYECPKCGNLRCKRGEVRATGSFLMKLLNIQNRRFVSYTCTRCGYTELFEAASSTAGNVLDFFTNG
jgi:uncharacterized protein